MNKKIKGSLAVVTAAAVAFGLTSVPAASAAVKTYTIGYQGPLSGGEASTGIDEQNAVKYAIKLFEAANKNIKIKLVSIDDQGDPAVAGTVAPGVASNKNVLGVVGPAYSGATIASLPYYKSVSMPVISPSATRVSLTDPTSPDFGGPIFHRVVGKDDLQGPALAKYATAGVSNAKVFVFDDQSAYAVPLRGFVEAGLKKVAGATVVGGDSVPNTAQQLQRSRHLAQLLLSTLVTTAKLLCSSSSFVTQVQRQYLLAATEYSTRSSQSLQELQLKVQR
jgi:branched-chain amino acid transport system substrate-binding protein